MKFKTPVVIALLVMLSAAASAQDNYLLPEVFYLHKNDTLKVHQYTGSGFKADDELKYNSSATKRFAINEAGKKANLMTMAKDSSAPLIAYKLMNSGLAMIEMISSPAPASIDREVYAKTLSDEGLVKLADQVNNSNQSQFREKSTRCMKALVAVDKPTGGDFDKPTGQDFEIVLKQSPYKMNYGDDITAVLYLKGKPLPAAQVDVYIKTTSGNIYPQTLSTDANGQISFNASRDGLYMLRAVKTEEATNNTDFDFETLQAAYVFQFSSQNEMPNDYHSFGFGNKH